MQKRMNIQMSQTKSYLTLPDAPAIPSLAFRFFQGKADFPSIEAVREAVQTVDGDLWLPGPDTNPDAVCNPAQDCLLASGVNPGMRWLVSNSGKTLLFLELDTLITPANDPYDWFSVVYCCCKHAIHKSS